MPYPIHDTEANEQRANALRMRLKMQPLQDNDFDYLPEYDGMEFPNALYGPMNFAYLVRHVDQLMIKYAINNAIQQAMQEGDTE